MKKVTIYHNNRCSKSRQALSFLNECHADVEVVHYISDPISKESLHSLLKKLGYNKYYEHIPFIKDKLGIKPPIMSPELEDKLDSIKLTYLT